MRTLLPALLATTLLATSVAAGAQSGSVFGDDFSDTGSGCSDNREAVQRGQSRGLGIYDESGHFQMTPLENDTIGLLPAPRQADSGNVRLRSTLVVLVSDGVGGGGLFCRARDRDNFYAFIVSPTRWSIVRMQQADSTVLASGELPAQVMPSAADGVLGAESNADTFTLRFNDKVMGSAQDAGWNEGQSGLLVLGTKLGSTNAQYDDFELEAL